MDVPRRLAELRDDFRGLLDEFEPRSVAVGASLFQVNVRTAMGVGQASGVLMAEAAARGAEVVSTRPTR